MKIEKILKIDTTVKDKMLMIFSYNIDIVYRNKPAISIDKFEKLQMEILAWHKSEVEKLNLPDVVPMLLSIAECFDNYLERLDSKDDTAELSSAVELMKKIVDDNRMFIRN